MANVTDAVVNGLTGSDPQNLLEYITRQKIYDSRFWKEECFGLTVADVLEKAASLRCIGNLPTKFLSLVLKLLQLHPETELVLEAFVQQDELKYVRALGCMYIRMTARPLDVYETLEAQYSDFRELRVWLAPEWSIVHMDEFIHQLLTQTHILGLALPRLPSRKTLEDADYLTAPRPTALKDVLVEYGGPLQYLKHKALVQQHPAAVEAWEKRRPPDEKAKKQKPEGGEKRKRVEEAHERKDESKNEKRKKERNYGTLFKKSAQPRSEGDAEARVSVQPEEGSEEYWNEQRAMLGLKPLQK